MTWSESVDEALCFGWIDGIRRTIDSESYCIRFTPRNPKSIWSAVNIKKVEELIQLGKMTPAGIAAFAKRLDARSGIYSYEKKARETVCRIGNAIYRKSRCLEFFQCASSVVSENNHSLGDECQTGSNTI